MATIQTVPGTQVAHAVVGAAPANLGEQLAPGDAMVGFGSAIARAGEVANELSNRLQTATNAADEVDAEVKMRKAQADYSDEMQTNQDPKTWLTNWQNKVGDLKEDVLGNEDLSPQARDSLTNKFKVFEQTSTTQVKTQAVVQQIRNKTRTLLSAADDAWDAGNFEAGSQPILSAVQAGLLSDSQAQDILKKGQTQVDFALVNKGLNVDPIATQDALNDQTDGGKWRNFKSLDENQREAMKGKADTAVNKLKADTLQTIYDKQNNGQLMTNDELQTLVDDRKLAPGTMKQILAQQAKIGKKPEVPELEQYSTLLTAASTYNPDSDPNNEQRANIIAQMAGLSPVYRDEVKSSLDRAVNKTGENQRLADGNNYIDELLHGGFLGNTKLAPDGTPYEPQAARQAFQRKVQLRDDLQGFIRANPKATPQDQFNFLNGKLTTQIDVGSATPILNALTGRAPAGQSSTQTQKVTSKAQWDALAPGTLYVAPDGVTYRKR